jgi:hypothetical protein
MQDKSILGGSMIVVTAQRLARNDAQRAASFTDEICLIFNGLAASHPSERARSYDG